MLEWKSKIYKIGWLAALLEACSDNTNAPAQSAITTAATTNPAVTPSNTTSPTSGTTTQAATTSQIAATTLTTTTAVSPTNATTTVASNITNNSPATTVAPAITPAPTPTPTPTKQPTPSPVVETRGGPPVTLTVAPLAQVTQRQLLAAGQGRAFGFAEDGRLYFYTRISGRTGTYTLNVADNAAQLQFLSGRLGLLVPDLSLISISDRANSITTLEEVANGAKRATLQNRASPTVISPDKTLLAYLLRGLNQDGPEAPQYFELWVGNIDGTGLKKIWDLREGANLTWSPNSHSLLLTARDSSNQRFGLWQVGVDAPLNQNAKLIVESKGLIQARLNSDGSRVAFVIALQGAANSGVGAANIDGSQPRRFDWTGGWRWSPLNPKELLYIPVRASNEPTNALWSYDLQSGQSQRLTNPTTTSLSVTGDEWQVAPDSKSLTYRNAKDNALWYLRFR